MLGVSILCCRNRLWSMLAVRQRHAAPRRWLWVRSEILSTYQSSIMQVGVSFDKWWRWIRTAAVVSASARRCRWSIRRQLYVRRYSDLKVSTRASTLFTIWSRLCENRLSNSRWGIMSSVLKVCNEACFVCHFCASDLVFFWDVQWIWRCRILSINCALSCWCIIYCELWMAQMNSKLLVLHDKADGDVQDLQ